MESLLEVRWQAREGRTYLVRWRGYGRSEDTLEPERRVKHTDAFARFVHKTPTLQGPAGGFSTEAQWRKRRRDPNPGDDTGSPLEDSAMATRLGLLRNMAASDAHRGPLDNLYSVLTDAFRVGPSRCRRKGPLRATCPCCFLTRNPHTTTVGRNTTQHHAHSHPTATATKQTPAEPRTLSPTETTSHTHLECPNTMLLLDTVYRAVTQRTASNAREQRRIDSLAPNTLTFEKRLPLVTGHHPESRLHAGGNIAPDARPWTALIAETHAVIEHRRRANADAADGLDWNQIRSDVPSLYGMIWRAMSKHATHTWQTASDREDELAIMYPEKDFSEDGPMVEWQKEWVKTGWANARGQLSLPARTALIKGTRIETATTPWAWRAPAALTIVQRWRAEQLGLDPPVMRAIAKAAPTQPTAEATDTVVYTDGAYDQAGKGGAQKGGFGFVIVRGGDGDQDREAREVARGWGQVQTNKASPAYLGAVEHTNNTAELTALAEALRWLRDEDPHEGATVLIRPDSEYVMRIATGVATPSENKALAASTHALYLELHKAREGRVAWAHVKGHSKHPWNDLADELAVKGAKEGEFGGGTPGRLWRSVRADGDLWNQWESTHTTWGVRRVHHTHPRPHTWTNTMHRR